jgi:ABC-type transport system involved in multi-copper enzyme maturation permease subunit
LGEPILAIPTIFLVMASLVIGASLVGAEWRSGTVTTNLTWESRRVRLATAKFLGAAIVGFGFTLVLQLVFVGLLLPNIAVNGSFDGADSDWILWFVEGLLRGSLLAGIVAAAGATLAMIGRNTTVAIAAGFVILSILEPILRGWKPWSDKWLLTTNASRLYFNDDAPLSDGALLSTGRAATVTFLYLALLVVGAVWLFQRRDVASVS